MFDDCGADFARPPNEFLRESYYDTMNFDAAAVRLAVDVAASDGVIPTSDDPHQIGSTSLMKASRFFARVKPALMIEVTGTARTHDSPSNELFPLMNGYGYRPYWFDGKNLRERMAGQWSVNYFFLQPAHLEQVARFIQG